jgi:hypothetical protein
MCDSSHSNYHRRNRDRRDNQTCFADWIVSRFIVNDDRCADDSYDTEQTYEKPAKKSCLRMLEENILCGKEDSNEESKLGDGDLAFRVEHVE